MNHSDPKELPPADTERGHLSAELVDAVCRNTLPPAELLVALRHLGSCPLCACLAAQLRPVGMDLERTLFEGSASSEHPDLSHLTRYVGRDLDEADREIVATHLDDCSVCRAELDRVRAARARRMRHRLAAVGSALAATIALVLYLSPIETRVRTSPPIDRQVSARRSSAPAQPSPPVERRQRYARGSWADLMERVAARGRLPDAAILTSLRPPGDVLRGGAGEAAQAFAPAGEVIDDTRPLFTWSPQPRATYVVVVFWNEEEAARSGVLREARWRPGRSLTRGRTYLWQVEVTTDDVTTALPAPPAPSPLFHVLSETARREIADAVRVHPDDHLLHAALYARAGLARQAAAAFQRAVASGDARAATIAPPARVDAN
ncbi:MAG TPA: hypothetical protein VNI54_12465 [Thermoanaerobaculia bacterium]|nr:hypothetical protein [Thermoanaerobaculia bacterium]